MSTASVFVLNLLGLLSFGIAQTCVTEWQQCYTFPGQTNCNATSNGCCRPACCPGLICGGTSEDGEWWAGCRAPTATFVSGAPYTNGNKCTSSSTTTAPATTTTKAPTTAAPATTTTKAPTTAAPATTTTKAPTTQAPVTTTTKAPTTAAPATTTTKAPTTQAPATTTTKAPSTPAPTTKAPTPTTSPPASCTIPEGSQCWGAPGSGSACGTDPNGCCSGCCASGQCGGDPGDNQYWKGCRPKGRTGGPTSNCTTGGNNGGNNGGDQAGVTTRYWDCCKPSCAWPGKASVSAPVSTCASGLNGAVLSDPNAQSGCDGGNSYTCVSQQPWQINSSFSLGFAATKLIGGSESSWCCACYLLTFTSTAVSGKKFLVQVTNTGGDLGSNHFDLQIPGGGVGIFTQGCPNQFGSWNGGAQYGGVSDVSQCSNLPSTVRSGCQWRFNWFQNADNPAMTFSRVKCPQALVDKTGCRRTDDSNYPTVYA